MNKIIKILMNRDGYTNEEAKEIFEDIQDRFIGGEDPEGLLLEIGLEPDYIFELLPF